MEKEKSSFELWAEQEIEFAIKKEKESAMKAGEENVWEYGAGCYESALKALRSLLEDEHSGMSISFTKNILNQLIDGRPLTPIEDTEDMWIYRYTREDGTKVYKCIRMSSLFKDIHPDGRITYTDVNRYYCRNIDSNVPYKNGMAANILDEMFPITMPYMPSSNPYAIIMDDFLADRKKGDFDTKAYFEIITPEGEHVEINRYYNEQDGKFVEITKEEYE